MLLLVCITVLVFSILVKLGFWQLDRATEKQQLQQALVVRQQTMPLRYQQVLKAKAQDPLTGYRLSLEVNAKDPRIILLDNQVYQGVVGYLAFQAVEVTANQPWLLIELGFISGTQDRRILPRIDGLTGTQELSGRLYQKSINPLSEHLLAETGNPLRIQNLNLTELAQLLQRPLAPAVLQPQRIGDKVLNQLPRPWQPIPMAAEKHQGYAVQWFSMAGAFLILMIYLLIIKIKNKHTLE
ncbi:SURF1 family protein [Shewanella sp. Isolate11]|uniref:SURF1 family protein n=1 Tax=Shewanella sp. Isolate11 TaxID=2908530 RepID=UPI001EFECDAD|nr:SURF1 family protein [Shewanella sp. Isolate11]MCG9698044.1 SURF1 family protein [Shewanella sp. Isolate11]